MKFYLIDDDKNVLHILKRIIRDRNLGEIAGTAENGMDALADLPLLNPDIVIVTDEIGYGIVPMDPFERTYREVVGRVCTKLAKNSESVYRVVCSIEMKLK